MAYRLNPLVLAGALAALAGPAQAQSAMPSGPMLGAACVLCHGPNGEGAGAIAALKGHTKDYIADMMTKFKSGERPSTVMGRFTKGFSDAEIDAVAAYYASLK
jgi:cytochrome c553